MADQARLPDNFIRSIIQFHYFRRHTAEQCAEYWNDFLSNENGVRVINNFCTQSYHLDRPYFRWIENRREEPPPVRNEALSDSDTSTINSVHLDHIDQEKLRIVKDLYRNYAENELNRIDPFLLDSMHYILSIHRIAPIERFRDITHPINWIEVTNGYRQLTMVLGHMIRPGVMEEPLVRIEYTCANGGTIIQSGNKVYEYRNIKYQSLAAKDFFMLVRNWASKIEQVFFLTENQNRWPFTSFFGKLKRYSETLNHKIWVVKFYMDFFENPDDPRTTEQGLIMKVLPFIEETFLEEITLRVMRNAPDVQVNSVALQNCIQWLSCPKVDIADNKIWVYDGIPGLDNLRRIHLTLPQVDLDALFVMQTISIPPGFPKEFVFPITNEIENAAARIRNIATRAFDRDLFEIRDEGIETIVTFLNPADLEWW